MVDQYLLSELVNFYHYQTLAKTAQKMCLTQPTLSRGMKKLEQELGVKLFEHQPNRLIFKPTGIFAAKAAANLLAQQSDFETQVKNFEASQKRIKIGATLPGPLLVLKRVKKDLPHNWQIITKLLPTSQIKELLLKRQCSLIFANQRIESSEIIGKQVGVEKLLVNLPLTMVAKNQKEISFRELQNLNFVVFSEIGPWRKLVQAELPKANLMFQEKSKAVKELIANTSYPFFKTNFSFDPNGKKNLKSRKRRLLPLKDENAKMPIYVNYLKNQPINWHKIEQIFSKTEKYFENNKQYF